CASVRTCTTTRTISTALLRPFADWHAREPSLLRSEIGRDGTVVIGRSPRMTEKDRRWPALPLEAWEPTRATLHMWTQIVGKIRLALSPYVNHWWQVPLYVSARGLTTSAIPCRGRIFEVEFDFIGHVLRISVSDGATRTLRLTAKSVAAFHAEFRAALGALGIEVRIWTMPVEIPDPIAFEKDTLHAAYDPDY